jgi:hypothetical protein
MPVYSNAETARLSAALRINKAHGAGPWASFSL